MPTTLVCHWHHKMVAWHFLCTNMRWYHLPQLYIPIGLKNIRSVPWARLQRGLDPTWKHQSQRYVEFTKMLGKKIEMVFCAEAGRSRASSGAFDAPESCVQDWRKHTHRIFSGKSTQKGFQKRHCCRILQDGWRMHGARSRPPWWTKPPRRVEFQISWMASKEECSGLLRGTRRLPRATMSADDFAGQMGEGEWGSWFVYFIVTLERMQ